MKIKSQLKLLSSGLFLISQTVFANDWPSRQLSLVVPYSAGGSTDATARLVANKLKSVLGQPVIVENKGGAGGNIGATYVAKAAPDGYTLLMATGAYAANRALYKSLQYDLVKDFVPVSQIARIPNVLVVNKDVPANNLNEFIRYAKDAKTPIAYGSAGSGTSQHLAGALFNRMTGTNMLHVPYKGGAPAMTDLLSGQIQLVFAPIVEVNQYVKGGQLKALAVTTPNRAPTLPNVQAVDEVLKGFDVTLWNGILAPAQTDPAIVEKLSSAIRQVLAMPDVQKALLDQGSVPLGNTPEQFKKHMESEIVKWAEMVQISGAKID